MKRRSFTVKSIFMASFLGVLLLFSFASQAAGTFRFLTQSLPNGSTDREYFSVLLTANAQGPVSFSVVALPAGLSLNTQTGYITGRPTTVNPNSVVQINAFDGTTTILFDVKVKITATGGGGNGGLTITKTSLSNGTVGTAYNDTITGTLGSPPYIWGAQNLPLGLSLNGLTGEISGTPISAGTLYVTFTLTDQAPNQIVTTIPITILPAASAFKFGTSLLNNGEVGTAYSDTWIATGAPTCGNPPPATVTYAASGLPEGLSVNASTGIVSGPPTQDGTFSVILTAQACDGTTITTNLWMWIAPSSTSNFYWKYFGIPAAIYGTQYGQNNFPILVSADNGTNVTYSAIGLPSGISYNSSTGELLGVSFEPGIYPVVFTATDTGPDPDVVITLVTEFIVLPPNGGDTNSLAVNLWVKNMQVLPGLQNANNDSWKATFIYNANRTAGKLFNPATETFFASLGASELEIPPGNFEKLTSGTLGVLSYVTPDNPAAPKSQMVKVRIAPSQQTISVEVKNTNLGTTLPADLLPNLVILGGKSYKLKEFLNSDGRFRAPFDYRNAAFVATSANIKNNASNTKNYARFQLLLSDPVFKYIAGDPVIIRILDGQNEWINKDLSTLLDSSFDIDRLTGLPTLVLSKNWRADTSASNQLSKFSFNSATGKLNIELKAPTLSSLNQTEKHIGLELTIGTKTYFSSLTLFKNSGGLYSSAK